MFVCLNFEVRKVQRWTSEHEHAIHVFTFVHVILYVIWHGSVLCSMVSKSMREERSTEHIHRCDCVAIPDGGVELP